MAYTDLTADQKRELQDWMQILRPMMGEFSRLCNHFEVAKDAHTAFVGDILVLLAPGDVVPNQSGLAGATDVTKTEISVALVDANAVLTAHNTAAKRQLLTKFAGAANLLG